MLKNWIVEYVPSEDNKETDRMTKMTSDREKVLQVFPENPFVLVFNWL